MLVEIVCRWWIKTSVIVSNFTKNANLWKEVSIHLISSKIATVVNQAFFCIQPSVECLTKLTNISSYMLGYEVFFKIINCL